jgi:hypothetical protein
MRNHFSNRQIADNSMFVERRGGVAVEDGAGRVVVRSHRCMMEAEVKCQRH